MNELKTGIKHTVTVSVAPAQTALAMGSGTLEVLATPAVIALTEKAACELIQPYLEAGVTSVGTLMSLEHISASPVGADIRAEAVLTAADGRKYCFDIFAYHNAGLIAKGKHERFLVKSESFMKKARAKTGERQ